MNQNNPYIFVIGNEKGGAGKTTCSMHLIAGLLDKGYNVLSIDADVRQQSLTTYINNRTQYNQTAQIPVLLPVHYTLEEVTNNDTAERAKLEEQLLQNIINSGDYDYVVIDTPGSHSSYSRLVHSYADTIITPINDSFVDLDVIAKITADNLDMSKPSIYSQMIWEQKINKASRDGGSINWFVMRNRLSNIDAINKRNIADAVGKLSKRLSFKVAPGFSERVIYRELFPKGLTLFDLNQTEFVKSFSLSHVAARQELRNFFDHIGIK